MGFSTHDRIPFEPLNWYYYPSIRISVTQDMNWTFRSAMFHLENYVNGLIVQWNRMGEDDLRVKQIMMSGDLAHSAEAAKAFTQYQNLMLFDVHFYLVCWDKVNKYFAVVSKSSKKDCVTEIWKKLSPLAEKASRARDYFEHLDRRLGEIYFDLPAYGLAGSRNFVFKYVDTSNKGKRFERTLTLGRDELQRVMDAYEEVLACLGADIAAAHLRPAESVKGAP